MTDKPACGAFFCGPKAEDLSMRKHLAVATTVVSLILTGTSLVAGEPMLDFTLPDVNSTSSTFGEMVSVAF